VNKRDSAATCGAFNGSPLDVFLIKNGLPQQPAANETPIQYSRRLLRLVAGLSHPQWVTNEIDGEFVTNAKGQLFQFGTNKFAGLLIFLTDNTSLDIATNLQQRGVTAGIEVGNCATCHTPPAFTDFIFHNNGAAQAEYDGIFGAGAFMALPVPGYSARQSNYNAYLPPTTNHPNASGVFAISPDIARRTRWFPKPKTRVNIGASGRTRTCNLLIRSRGNHVSRCFSVLQQTSSNLL
jgi:hypothetical protein